MVEIPEHLLKRSQEAMAKAKAAKGEAPQQEAPAEPVAAASGAPEAETPAPGAGAPAEVDAAQAAAEAPQAAAEAPPPPSPPPANGGGGNGASKPAPSPRAPAATRTAAATAAAPARTQRLLAVVKAGSIQQTKADPVDKVNTWPHLLVGEFVALLLCTAFLIVFSVLFNAPLQAQANANLTPNPSKAPWYFLGLQELLTLFHPMVAGVTVPGIGIFALIVVPYIDRNPATKPSERKFAIALFTFFLMYWAILVLLGSFFRGPGFNFVWPWSEGLFFDF
jgi:menaquinol-cytochrome c reductase cytochrome b/c subunit